MRIHLYQYHNTTDDQWNVKKFPLDDFNLLVSMNGMGKTRILNTIHNLFLTVHNDGPFKRGAWEVDFSIGKNKYNYKLRIDKKDVNSSHIIYEKLKLKDKIIIDRNLKKFVYNDTPLPKLSQNQSAISLLKDEPQIKKIFDEFDKILLEKYSPHIVGMPLPDLIQIHPDLLNENDDNITYEFILKNGKTLDVRLFFIKKYHQNLFQKIKSKYIEIFPFVEDITITEANTQESYRQFPINVPLVCIREKGIDKNIPKFELSSGMHRCLEEITSIYLLPSDSIYLIDEFENGLGFNTIQLMIDVLLERYGDIQIIMTSHHPYLIKNIDEKSIFIVDRECNDVKIISFKTMLGEYGPSVQDKYIKLINSKYFEKFD